MTIIPAGLEDVVIYNFSIFSRGYVLILAMIFSLFYVFYYKRYLEKETSLFSLGALRLVLTIFSWINIFLIPLFGIMFNPFDDGLIASVYIGIYLAFLGVFGLVLFVDFLYYAPTLIMNMMGLDIGDPKVRSLKRDIENEFSKVRFIRNGRR